MKKILFISAFLITLNSNAQNIDNMCGTDVPENYFEILEEKRDLIEKHEREYYQLKQNRTSTAITNVHVKIHIVNFPTAYFPPLTKLSAIFRSNDAT